MPQQKRPLSKAAIAGIVFVVLMFGLILFQTMGLRQYECEVCMEFEGQRKCLTVRGESEQQAIQTAVDNACSYITNGRAEGFRCSATPPASVQCKQI